VNQTSLTLLIHSLLPSGVTAGLVANATNQASDNMAYIASSGQYGRIGLNPTELAISGGLGALPAAGGAVYRAWGANGAKVAAQLSPAEQAAAWQGSELYPGIDRYRNILLKPGTYVVGASPGQGNYYTTMSGMARSELDVVRYYQGVQLAPNLTNPAYDVVRDGLTVYRVAESTPAAFSRTLANSQYGAGGLPQLYIPNYSGLQPVEFMPFVNKVPGVRP
jgi:hypothetical protein